MYQIVPLLGVYKRVRGLDKRATICHFGPVSSTFSWRSMMALVAHLAELTEKHRVLKRKIEDEVARPGSDDLEIHRLKVEKLKIKDEIARLQEEEVRH